MPPIPSPSAMALVLRAKSVVRQDAREAEVKIERKHTGAALALAACAEVGRGKVKLSYCLWPDLEIQVRLEEDESLEAAVGPLIRALERRGYEVDYHTDYADPVRRCYWLVHDGNRNNNLTIVAYVGKGDCTIIREPVEEERVRILCDDLEATILQEVTT